MRLNAVSSRVSNQVILAGAVARPGVYAWQQNMQVNQLIRSLWSDLLPSADLNYAIIVREANQKNDIKVLQFNLADIDSSAIALQPRDIVLVFHHDNHTYQRHLLNDYIRKQLAPQLTALELNAALVGDVTSRVFEQLNHYAALKPTVLQGKPFTANLPRQESSKYPNAKQFGLVLDRSNLDEKIDQRVDDMWAKGFAREVSLLMTQGLEQATTAKKALGYSQIMSYLNGECDEEFAKQETKRVTRAYARRQETWFSRDDRIKWLAPDSMQIRLEKLLASIN